MSKSPSAVKLRDPNAGGPNGIFYGTKNQQRLVTIVFLLIPLLLLFMFTYLPFFKMIQFSFYNRNYLSEGTWVGLKNYVDVFKRDDCFKTLIVSVYYMGGAVVQLGLALFFASLMVFGVKGSSIYKSRYGVLGPTPSCYEQEWSLVGEREDRRRRGTYRDGRGLAAVLPRRHWYLQRLRVLHRRGHPGPG